MKKKNFVEKRGEAIKSEQQNKLGQGSEVPSTRKNKFAF